MSSFAAQERTPALEVIPGSKVPSADEFRIRSLGADEFYPRKWEYTHPEHTTRDIIRPGYFSDETRARLNVGDEIHYTAQAKSRVPSEWERGILVVEEKPNTKEKPLIVAIIHRYSKATPVRHDGEAVE